MRMLSFWSRIILNARVSFATKSIASACFSARPSKTARSARSGPAKLIMDKAVVDLTNDSDATASPDASDDEDLRRAIAPSLEADATGQSSPNGDCIISSGPKQPQFSSSTLNGFLGIDRKKQEQERLARLKRKRERNVSPPQLTRKPFSSRLVTNDVAPSTNNVTLPSSASSNPTSADRYMPISFTPQSSTLQYPTGIVKQTWVFGHPRSTRDIKIEEVLQPSSLQAAVLSAFQWDFDWLFPKMHTKRTSFVLVMQAKYESQQKHLRSDFEGIPNVRLCFPSMEGQVNCMHSKLMLLFHEEYMRVVIPTGNLRPHDWGENGGVMENTVFLIDLPRSSVATTAEQRPQFAEDLLYFIKAQRLPDDVIRKVFEHDFSRTADLGFVHTIGGVHTGDSWKLTGHCGLGRTIAGLGLGSKSGIEVDYVTSSVGSLNEEFLRSIYLTAQGDDGLSEYTLRTSKAFPAKCMDDPKRIVRKDVGADWKQKFRIYYPSDTTVRASTGGPDSAGTICFQEKWWNGAKFPRGNMHDCVSRRTGLLMHNKVSDVRLQTA
jgi:Tyrosyl-DNA phosphodiesterase